MSKLTTKLGGDSISNIRRLSGGASQETWFFELTQSDGSTRPLVLRRCPIEGPRNSEALGLVAEANVMRIAKEAGVLVANVVYVCSNDDGLGDAFIMDFVAGETLARRILRDAQFANARSLLAGQCGTELAKIHKMPMLAELPRSDGISQLKRYQDIYCSFNINRPIIELAFQWLLQTAPKPVQLGLVHGDFRNGNLIVRENGLCAVLDWELAHIGDPREDLGWICVNSWRFGQSHQRVGGFGAIDHMMDAYEAAGGQSFKPKEIAWFQALGSLKWAIMCLIMYHAFETGADPSIERAMIGRRTSEAEIDLLNLMEDREHA